MDNIVSIVSHPSIGLLKNILLLIFVYRNSSRWMRFFISNGIDGSFKTLSKSAVQIFFYYIRKFVPAVERQVRKQVCKSVDGIQKKLVSNDPVLVSKAYVSLPKKGLSDQQVKAELTRYKNLEHVDWQHGRVSGAIYHGGDDLNKLITEAYGMFSISNPLHPEIFPGIRQMEAEIISMTLNMYNAPEDACGNVTSGGTESLLMAVKTYRDYALDKRGVTEPEIVVPITVHAAIDKAAEYFRIKVIHIPMNPKTGKVDVKAMKRAITSNTICIVGSAPNFPHGIVDDIPALSDLALKYKIGLHVDACLGGFLVPFLDKAGYPLPYQVDFRVKGVTSISVDPHKYGFAPKGSSVILYRNQELRNYQYFVTTDWPGGVYASPSISGSRPGALVAGCWAAMIRMGEQGYIKTTKDIVQVAQKIITAVNEIPELETIGDPLVSVVAFKTTKESQLKTYRLADLLNGKGWHLNIIQFPEAIHIACTLPTKLGVDDFIADLKSSVELLRSEPSAGDGEVAAIYGTAASVPDRSIIKEVCIGFLDALTMMPKKQQ